MKLQKCILTVGAVTALGLGSINPAHAGEFKLLQNFLNSISILGGSAEPAPNSMIEVGPVINPQIPPLVGNPIKELPSIRPIRPVVPFGPPPIAPGLDK